MFITATKIAVVEAFRSIWFENQNVGQENFNLQLDLTPNDAPIPRRVTIEYPEESQNWPFILVQFHPTVVRWTGISPDEIVDAAEDEDSDTPQWRQIRQGYFEGSIQLQIMSETSGERDRIWDNLIGVILMGRKRAATRRFFSTLETDELVGITINESSVDMVGDTISMGTPWDPELLSYEATIAFDVVGTFYADEYAEDLVPLTAARVYNYIDFADNPEASEPPPHDTDGLGTWTDPWV